MPTLAETVEAMLKGGAVEDPQGVDAQGVVGPHCTVQAVRPVKTGGYRATLFCPAGESAPAAETPDEPAPTVVAEGDGASALAPQPSLEEGLRFCLTKPEMDTETRVLCLGQMVAAEDTEPADRLVLLTQPGCPHCDRARMHYAEILKEGLLEDVDIYSPRGLRLAKEAGIDYTPGLVVARGDGALRVSLGNALTPALKE